MTKVINANKIRDITPHIKVDHKLEKIKRFINAIHGKSNISLVNNDFISVRNIHDSLQRMLSDIVSEVNFSYKHDNTELQVIHMSKLISIDTSARTVALAVANQPTATQSVKRYDSLHDCLSIIYNFTELKVCASGKSSACPKVLSSGVKDSTCGLCKNVERSRKRKVEKTAVKKTFDEIDDISPEFGGHVRNQLQRRNNPNHPYEKRYVLDPNPAWSCPSLDSHASDAQRLSEGGGATPSTVRDHILGLGRETPWSRYVNGAIKQTRGKLPTRSYSLLAPNIYNNAK